MIVLQLFALLIIMVTPFLFIWSINTLFQTMIPFTFKTWLAGIVLLGLTRFWFKRTLPSNYITNQNNQDYIEDKEETNAT
ncbi:MAG: hypothetical protein HQK77_14000 [Desulfobacterales bacterium]|nr:hypothetical protein [Desulfobacterales bacterium]